MIHVWMNWPRERASWFLFVRRSGTNNPSPPLAGPFLEMLSTPRGFETTPPQILISDHCFFQTSKDPLALMLPKTEKLVDTLLM